MNNALGSMMKWSDIHFNIFLVDTEQITDYYGPIYVKWTIFILHTFLQCLGTFISLKNNPVFLPL